MSDGVNGVIPYHSRACPQHHFAYLFPHLGAVAVDRAFLAFHLLKDRVHHLTGLTPCGKEIDQNKLTAIYYTVECLHLHLSISVNRLKVLPSLVTFSKNIFSGLTQYAISP